MLYSYQKKDETCEHTSNNSKPVNNNKIGPTTVKDSPNEKSTLDNSNEEKTEKVDPNVKSKADALKDKGMANNKKTETNVVTKTVSIQTEESNHHPENNADNATYEYNVNDEVVKTNDTKGLHQIESVATEKVEFSQQQSTRLNLKTNNKRFLPGITFFLNSRFQNILKFRVVKTFLLPAKIKIRITICGKPFESWSSITKLWREKILLNFL